MTPQRWKGAGILFFAITVLLVVGALLSVLSIEVADPINFGPDQVVPAGLVGVGAGLLRGVVLGAFAGVSFFISLACFMWSGFVEAKEQRAEILAELSALRIRAEKSADTGNN